MKAVPKSKKRKQQKSSQIPATQIPTIQERRSESSSTRKLVELVLGISTVGGVVLAALSFYPRPVLDVGQPTDPSDALSAPLNIGNASLVPLRNVRIGMGICKIEIAVNGKMASLFGDTDKPNCHGNFESIMLLSDWTASTMNADDKKTIFLSDFFKVAHFNATVVAADVGVSISYHLWFLPWEQRKQYHLTTRRLDGGSYTWQLSPID